MCISNICGGICHTSWETLLLILSTGLHCHREFVEKPCVRVSIDGKTHLHGLHCHREFVEKPCVRVSIDGKTHLHGFKLGSESHTVEATIQNSGALNLTSGIAGLSLLKTTQSGFEGFVRDKYTILPGNRGECILEVLI